MKTKLEFIPYYELKALIDHTGMVGEELLTDFLLYCETAEIVCDYESWKQYYDETMTFV